ncbi:MAG TPA: BatD family protein [Chthoniobacterales bacterium]|nr:BatD family protein [Chthoniobacterales bacterium]
MRKILVTIFFFWLWAGALAMADTAVSASLSETSTDVDHPVQLDVKIENARVTRPPNVTADGLSIDFAGTSSQTQILNFKASSVTTFTYIVTPTKAGLFQIPPIEVVAGGKVYKTASLTLQVVQENGGNADGSTNPAKPFFAELIVPKESAYVGEMIPIELRFYFIQGIEYQPYPQGQFPLFDGDGFVTKKYPEPIEKRLIANGRTYNVVVYRTGLCGVKPGKLDLNSATQTFLVAAPFGPRSAPGLIDPTQPYQQQVAEIKTNGASILIKSIPTAGRPASFSGAVGEFTLATSVNPLQAQTGDPIKMEVEISGLGNFDRMEQPVLSSTDGWRVYQPSEQLKALDEIGLSGTKRYSYVLIAAKPVNMLPAVEFSYFNPTTEKFVTLKSTPTNIQIDGPPLPDIVATPGAQGGTPAQKSKPRSVPDVLDIRVDPPVPASFVPLIRQRGFWIEQAIPAIALLLLGSAAGIRKVVTAREPQWKANREKRLLWRKIVGSKSRPEVLQAAVRLLELSPGKRSGRQKGLFRPVEESMNDKSFPDDLRNEVRDLLAVREATIYGHVGSESLSEDERTKIKSILTRWKATA